MPLLTVPSRAFVAVLALAVVASSACQDDEGDLKGVPFGGSGSGGRLATGGQGGGGRDASVTPMPDVAPLDAGELDAAEFNCPATPVAHVLETTDPWTMQPSAATALLTAAGFEVRPLPLDADPAELRGLIVLGSFASESPVYKEYVARNAARLYTFVDKANVLLQLTQADQTEPSPPFLPSNLTATRHDLDDGRLVVTASKSPLIAGVPLDAEGALAWQFPQLSWESFVAQGGFEVVLANTASGRNPALLEGAYGQGRIVLTSMPLDKPVGAGPARDAFNAAFFRNLRDHVTRVCERRGPPLTVTPSSTQPGFAANSTMLAVLPDTQIYSLLYPGIFTAQTSWIAANATKRRIPYVLHLGDIVDRNSPLEWERAALAMAQLHGVVPYALATGNHDYGPVGNARTRDTYLNDYFAFDTTAAWPTFGGALEPGKLDNTYHLATIGNRDYVILALEWGPRDGVVEWADRIMQQHPDRYGILITHAYLNSRDRRHDRNDTVNDPEFNPHIYGTAGGVNDGEELWQKLVRKHRFVLVFNGHVLNDGTGYLASVTDHGNICHQMLSNYQFRNLGGEGYMRLVEFLEDGRTVRVFTYSPLYDNFLTEPDQSFTFTIDVPASPRP